MGSEEPAAQGRGLTLGDYVFGSLAAAMALLVVAVLGAIILLLFFESNLSIHTFGLQFLTGTIWQPVAPEKYSALVFVYGTLYTSALAMLFGIPVSIGVAIFLTELSPTWLRVPISFVVELLAAVPSVIYGLWGFFVLAPIMRDQVEPVLQSIFLPAAAIHSGAFYPLGFLGALFGGTPFGVDKLTAGVILTIMVIPTISAITREAFLQVPQSQREAALSLGATRWETTRIAVIGYARSGIFGAVILGLGRALGETMAVTMTIGNSDIVSGSLLSKGQTIASKIANVFAEAPPLQQSALLELGLILLLITLLINMAARLLIGRLLRVEEGRE